MLCGEIIDVLCDIFKKDIDLLGVKENIHFYVKPSGIYIVTIWPYRVQYC